MSNEEEGLIDPSLLANLTEEQRAEALAAAAAAKRAEERAEQRALERAMERRRLERMKEREQDQAGTHRNSSNGGGGMAQKSNVENEGGKVVFISKKRRRQPNDETNQTSTAAVNKNQSHNNNDGKKSSHSSKESKSNKSSSSSSSAQPSSMSHHLTPSELNAIKASYLGESALQDEETARQQELEQQRRSRQKKKIMFKFEWDASEDTSAADDLGILPSVQATRRNRGNSRRGNNQTKSYSTSSSSSKNTNVETKPFDKMTVRDWRIFRENYDISVKGGKCPPPLRSFRESNPPIHSALLNAIESVLKYKAPSPIQRQAIPIGLQRRDLIGVAETGSGKTCAFSIPLCHHIFTLPDEILATVPENGPLALVMAPTRELALQIDAEVQKLLSRQSSSTNQHIRSVCIVGGQPIQNQAMTLRNGVHIVVGTPGRLNDCIEMSYLVLNQCSYVVLDEADRMIDLGFAPQIEQILDAMGGLLKSENEKEAYEQEVQDLKLLQSQVPKHRLTAMFSATMPNEVQRIAKQYLRHPAIVSVGDQDSGKNQRIEQRCIFLSSPSAKERALKDVLLRQTRVEDKVIVFVNEKKHADGVGRIVERIPRRCVVLHGGKSQEQREANLDLFRRGGVVLVATDVAGRGLDIPNVKHVINYDVPARSIDNYCHRIGRTGRAGNQGFATSFVTDEDEGIMAALKQYLESTGAPVPDRLARHPAAASNSGGKIIQ